MGCYAGSPPHSHCPENLLRTSERSSHLGSLRLQKFSGNLNLSNTREAVLPPPLQAPMNTHPWLPPPCIGLVPKGAFQVFDPFLVTSWPFWMAFWVLLPLWQLFFGALSGYHVWPIFFCHYRGKSNQATKSSQEWPKCQKWPTVANGRQFANGNQKNDQKWLKKGQKKPKKMGWEWTKWPKNIQHWPKKILHCPASSKVLAPKAAIQTPVGGLHPLDKYGWKLTDFDHFCLSKGAAFLTHLFYTKKPPSETGGSILDNFRHLSPDANQPVTLFLLKTGNGAQLNNNFWQIPGKR